MIAKIWSWINTRWPLSSLVHLALDEEIPGGSRFFYTLGSSLLTIFLLQAVTGILQLFYYVPTVDHAYNSVNFLRTRIPFGWLINGLHYWGANAMIAVIVLHIIRVFLWGAYKTPRELTWFLGITLLLLTMGSSFTGGPLSWDQKAYWEAEVGTSMPGSLPVIGDTIKQIMRGGEAMGQLTISRLFIVHAAILPAGLLAAIGAHLIAFRRFGSVGPWNQAQRQTTGLFWPDQVVKDALMGTLIILILISLTVFAPKPFNGAADPLDSAFIPKPEWNFLFLYEALKFFQGNLEPIGVVGVPTVLVLLLVALPLIDRKPERNPARRPVAMASGAAFLGLIVALTMAGAYSKPEGGAPASPVRGSARGAGSSAGSHQGSQLVSSQGCLDCHRIDNSGGTIGPNLSGEGLRGRTRDWLATQIRNPKAHNPNTIMPAFTSMSDSDVSNLVDYLLSLKAASKASTSPSQVEKEVPPSTAPSGTPVATPSATARTLQKQPGAAVNIIGSAERGASLFERDCSSCHGVRGAGGMPNPGSKETKVPPLNPLDRELFSKDPRTFVENIDKFIQHGSVPSGPGPSLRMIAFGDTNSLTQQQIANIEAYIMILNGVDRAQIINPGIQPRRFFVMVIPAVLLILFILGGIYRCLPCSDKSGNGSCTK